MKRDELRSTIAPNRAYYNCMQQRLLLLLLLLLRGDLRGHIQAWVEHIVIKHSLPYLDKAVLQLHQILVQAGLKSVVDIAESQVADQPTGDSFYGV